MRLAVVLAAVTVVSFVFMHLIPGDPATIRLGEHASPQQVAELRSELGLDQPLPVQLWKYVLALSHGDLGTSVVDSEPVLGKLVRYFRRRSN